MEQLELLAIRQQPLPREIPIASKVIRQYVKENLRGFARRQAERERIRVERRKREKPRTKRPKQEHNMRAIKVTYRAVFEQPIRLLNPMSMKLPGPMPVELFQAGGNWKARSILNGMEFKRLDKFASFAHGQTVLADSFERQLTPWEMWGKPPDESEPRELVPKEIHIAADGSVFWRQAEDFTHIIHAPSIPPGARIPPAACGAKVNAKCFISTKANVEPSCEACAEVWRKEYKGK